MNNWRGWLLAATHLALGIAASVVPAMPQPLSYHAFADGPRLGHPQLLMSC